MLRVAFWQETRKQPEHLGYTPLEIDRRITADFRMSAHGPKPTCRSSVLSGNEAEPSGYCGYFVTTHYKSASKLRASTISSVSKPSLNQL